MVASAELAADFRDSERGVSTLARYIATWRGRTTARARRLLRHLGAVDAVELADRALDLVDRDPPAVGREDIGQLLLGQLAARPSGR